MSAANSENGVLRGPLIFIVPTWGFVVCLKSRGDQAGAWPNRLPRS